MKLIPKPRPAQKLAIKAAVKGLLGRFHRALVILATGLGKTLASAFIAKKLGAKKILFLVHNNFILSHAMEEYQQVFGEKTKMVLYNGMNKKGIKDADIVFATWQTMGGSLKKWAKDHFDLIVVDEAHHTEADTYRPTVDYFTGMKLGITATPERDDDKDIREVFGHWVINIQLEEAIARGWLPMIEYHVIADESLDENALQKIASEIKAGKKRFTMAEVNRRIFIKKRDTEITRIINGYEEKAVVFCASISHAERMKKTLKLADTFHSRKGRTPKKTWNRNQATLDALKNGKIRRVCAVNAFNEGVNVPSIGLVAFCRVAGVINVFRQQLGRGLRPGKEKLIVLDFVGNLERIRLLIEMMNRISDLHEKFTSEKERDFEGYVRKPFEVSGKGFEFTFSNNVVDMIRVLEHCEREFYPTWQEASRAAVRLGIKTSEEYNLKFRIDPKLPSAPHKMYRDFPGWNTFLAKILYYGNWREASRSSIKLKSSNGPDYRKKRHLDPRLPKNPDTFYLDFPGWDKFLGRAPKKFYKKLQEASDAAVRLGIKSQKKYPKMYKKDPLLPANPQLFYSDFPGWERFLGKTPKEFYSTCTEASAAAVKLEMKGKIDYVKRRGLDPRLPSNPDPYYSDFPGWVKFLGKTLRSGTFYQNWQDASKAVMRLGIDSVSCYRKKRSLDQLLPRDPPNFYGDFPGWDVFLGKKRK